MAITTDDLRAAGLGGLFEDIDAAVADHLEGDISNVAVIADPFSCREVLVEYADESFGVVSERVSFDGVVDSPDDIEFPNTEVVVIDGCHYLYTRQIGGYDVLDHFLSMVVDRDAMFVTAWNRYAWDYIAAIRDVEHVFPVQIRVPTLDSGGITELLVSQYGPEMPEFVQTDTGGRVKSVGIDHHTVSLLDGHSVSVPVPSLNLEYITSRSNTDQYGNVEAVVFEKLTYLSDGNPGIAGRLWERSVRDGEIAPAYVEEVETTIDLDADEAFLLELVLAKEEMEIRTLQDVLVSVPVKRSLGTLIHQEVLERSGDTVRLVPERLYAAVEHLQRRQLIW